ncbi:MAG: hypothetical protein M3362_28055, partial [Acidobacteriota bacterium]|nr:hypothetical protein [Acidobacteriota bacterium]
MSKKPARSDRESDLPDWAEEVTPSDEVMRKFYAPTGAFKTGPISVPPPESAETETPAKQAKSGKKEADKNLAGTEPERMNNPAHSSEALQPTEVK